MPLFLTEKCNLEVQNNEFLHLVKIRRPDCIIYSLSKYTTDEDLVLNYKASDYLSSLSNSPVDIYDSSFIIFIKLKISTPIHLYKSISQQILDIVSVDDRPHKFNSFSELLKAQDFTTSHIIFLLYNSSLKNHPKV